MEPLFPLSHDLSYATFRNKGLHVEAAVPGRVNDSRDQHDQVRALLWIIDLLYASHGRPARDLSRAYFIRHSTHMTYTLPRYPMGMTTSPWVLEFQHINENGEAERQTFRL